MTTLKLLFIFLCLSVGLFSQQTVGIFQNTSESFNGYTLFGNNEMTYLIDNCGFTINTWESEFDPGLAMHLLENGNLLRTAKISGNFFGGGLGGRFEIFDWEGNLLNVFNYVSDKVHAHHDVEPLPNGNFLLLAWEKFSKEEAQQMGRIYDAEVWSEKIVEIKLTSGGVPLPVWEWRLWDHLVQDYNNTLPNYGIIADHPELVDVNFLGAAKENDKDWIHANAIAYNPALDQIAISSRNFGEIWIIDHSTTIAEAAGHNGGLSGKGGDLLYRYGNPLAYDRGNAGDQTFFNQHDIRWIPEGYPHEGKLMVFNNDDAPDASSVEIWSTPVDINGNYTISDGVPFGPLTTDWEFSASGFYSDIMSGAQMLANGNVLICEGQNGLLFEVTPEKEIVWEYVNPVNQNGNPVAQGGTPVFNNLFRATRYALDYPAFENKDLTPGSPVEINPWDLDCSIFITDTKTPQGDTKIKILGNPVKENLVLALENGWSGSSLNLYDLTGKLIRSYIVRTGINILALNEIPSGVYLMLVKNKNARSSPLKVLIT